MITLIIVLGPKGNLAMTLITALGPPITKHVQVFISRLWQPIEHTTRDQSESW